MSLKQLVKKQLFRIAPEFAFGLIAWYRRRRDFAKNLAARKFARAEIFKNGEPVVVAGPFAGMRYIDDFTFGPIVHSWLGIYEPQLAPSMRKVIEDSYDTIIDIGAAEGYYAVGIARARPDLPVITFEADPYSRDLQRRMAKLNGVTNIDIRALCDHQTLEATLGKRPFVLCDIEGGEVDLIDPMRTPGLRRADLIVETHLHEDKSIPEVTKLLADRFRATHTIEVVREPHMVQRQLLDEVRKRGVTTARLDDLVTIERETPNEWLILTALKRSPAAAQPAVKAAKAVRVAKVEPQEA